uniref:SPK domain-containing protein n=1 Tax=Caenorhabditis japonica TaxID=281687 RepID=A0A8R1ELD7_CAEJA
MYFFYKLPVESVFLDVLKLEADIEIDENGCILKYKEKKEGGFALDAKGVPDEVPETSSQKSVNTTLGNSDAEDCKPMCSKLYSSARRLKFTEEEDLDMWNFLLKQISIPKTGNAEKNRIFSKGITIWEEYKKQTSTPRGVSALNTRFRRMMAPKLHEANLPKESKLKLYYELRIPVDGDYLERLRKAAEVRVDNEGCITMYRKRSPEDGKKRRIVKGNEEEKEKDDGTESDASGRSEP